MAGKAALIVGVLFVLMLALAMCQGCTMLGKIHFLDMSDQWCAAHPDAPTWRNCK